MGFYAEYFSTLMKGPWATSIKERVEARRAMNALKRADKKEYQQLPELVERDHRVTKAIGLEENIVRDLNVTVDNGAALAFNNSTMDLAVLEVLNNLVEAWAKVERAIESIAAPALRRRLLAIQDLFGKLMHKGNKKAEAQDREAYSDVAVFTNINPGEDHEKFMQVVRLRFQNVENQSVLAKFAIRSSIRKQKLDLGRLKVITTRLHELSKQVNFVKGQKPNEIVLRKSLDSLEGIAKESAADFEEAFFESYLIKRRDSILMMKVLANTNYLSQLNKKWVAMHFMPEEPIRQRETAIKEIQAKIAKKFHTIAQALRISISGLGKVDRKLAAAA